MEHFQGAGMSTLRAGRPLGRKRTWFLQFSTEAYLWMFWLPSSCLCFLKTQKLLLEKECVALMPLSVKVFRQL